MTLITDSMPRDANGWYLLNLRGRKLKICPWKSVVSYLNPANGLAVLPAVPGKMYLVEAVYLTARMEAANAGTGMGLRWWEDTNNTDTIYLQNDVQPSTAGVWTLKVEDIDAFTSDPTYTGMDYYVNGAIASTSVVIIYRDCEFA